MTKMRCHFSMFITRTLKAMWAVLAAIAAFIIQSGLSGELMTEINSRQSLLLLGMSAVFLGSLGFNFFRWRKTFITIDEENLIVDRRTINANKTAVKLSTISSVNLRRGVLEKIFGTCRLQLDIDSSATADKTDFDLVFKKEQAIHIRDQIVASAEVEQAAKQGSYIAVMPQREPRELLYSFSFSEVMRHCLLGLSVGSIIGAAVGFGIWFWSSGLGDGNISWLPIIIVVFPAVYQFIRPFFLYQNFRLEKSGNYLHVSYGLIASQHFALPLDKTNAMIINRPALARMFNLCSGEIINIGMGDARDNQAPLFCLLLSPKRVYEIIIAIAPQYAAALPEGDSSPLQRSPKPALWPVLLRWLLWAIILATAAIIWGKIAIAIIVLLAMLFAGYLSWRTKELALLEDKISISTGVFAKRNITADYGKLQRLIRKSGPVSNRLGLAQGQVSILASSIHQNNLIGYFPAACFDRIEAEILRSAAEKKIMPVAKNADRPLIRF